MNRHKNSVVVAGGREYAMTEADFRFLERELTLLGAKRIHTDGTSGVAAQVERWAEQRGTEFKRVTADWLSEGEAPLGRRNSMLANLAGVLIVFPGDDDTTNLVLKARAKKVPISESPSRQLANLRAMPTTPRLRPGPRISP